MICEFKTTNINTFAWFLIITFLLAGIVTLFVNRNLTEFCMLTVAAIAVYLVNQNMSIYINVCEIIQNIIMKYYLEIFIVTFIIIALYLILILKTDLRGSSNLMGQNGETEID